MDWTRITDNQRVITLLKKRQKIEEEIKAIDENALIMYELEVLSIPNVVGRSEQLANFCKKVSKQEDCPVEFQEIVNKEFWNLIG